VDEKDVHNLVHVGPAQRHQDPFTLVLLLEQSSLLPEVLSNIQVTHLDILGQHLVYDHGHDLAQHGAVSHISCNRSFDLNTGIVR
jgi:hypothetical protein